MDTLNAWPPHGKRKEPDDFVHDLFGTFNLSPPKKPRIAVEGEPVAVSLPVAIPAPILPSPPQTPLEPVPVVPATLAVPAKVRVPAAAEEKALVLYRPVNPPLFPGGPPAGSAELPFQFDASFIRSQAIGFPDSVELGPRQLCGLSSTSPASSLRFKDQDMLEDREATGQKYNMAVIPWVPSLPFAIAMQATSESAQPVVDTDILEDHVVDPMDISMDEEFSGVSL